jgi:hypothetical protein
MPEENLAIATVQNAAKALSAASTAEQITAFLNIATSLARDLLLARGWTGEEWNTYRKQLVADEIAFIDAEIARLEGGGDPLPV